jgi:hypothetical protein
MKKFLELLKKLPLVRRTEMLDHVVKITSDERMRIAAEMSKL